MPFTPPSIYAPGTVDLLSLIMQAKSGTAGLHRSLTGKVSSLEDLDLGKSLGGSSSPTPASSGPATASSSVGTSVVGAIGNAVMGAAIGPVGMAVLGLMGITPPSAMSQAFAALGITGKAPDVGTMAAGISEGNQADTESAADAASVAAESAASDFGLGESGSGSGSGDSGSGDSGSASVGDSGSSGEAGLGGYAKGGLIKGKGTSTSDSIFIKASDGEYMLPIHVVEALGKPFLDRLVSSIPNVLDGN